MALRRRVQLKPLVANLPLRHFTMPSIQTERELVHWDSQGRLMAHILHQSWLSETGTTQQGDITSAFMAPLAISLVFVKVSTWCGYLLLHLHLALHSPPPISVRESQTFVGFPSPLVPKYNSFLNSSLCCVYTMPRERGKPKHELVYYSLISRHRRTGAPSTPSLPPNPSRKSLSDPYSNQNWHDDAQPTPQMPDPTLNYGGCLVEEEIPPNWMEDIKEPTEPTGIALLVDHPDIDMGGCVVEEEIPP
jgi:hypothetical protein